MEIKLVLLKNDGSYRPFELPSEVTVVGRRKCCDLQIPLRSVSRRHCQLNIDDGVLEVRDLGSRNGTLVNNQEIRKTELGPGDALQIGPLTFICQVNNQPENLIEIAEKYAKSLKAASAAEKQHDTFGVAVDQTSKQPKETETANAETDDLDAILEQAELGDSGGMPEDFDPFEK